MGRPPVLAIDLGGSKIAVALVDGPEILERRETPTDRAGCAEEWVAAVAGLVAGWSGYSTAALP